MTDINSLNAVTRDRARIREAIGAAPSVTIGQGTIMFERNQVQGVYVLRASVLAALGENVVLPRKIPVQCACCLGSAEHYAVGVDHATGKDDTVDWHAHPSRQPMFVPTALPHQKEEKTATKRLVVMDYSDGKVYVYPVPDLVVHESYEDWLWAETEHKESSCYWMITSEDIVQK